jgi:hypothetical protein
MLPCRVVSSLQELRDLFRKGRIGHGPTLLRFWAAHLAVSAG